jgi:hypothetical protein
VMSRGPPAQPILPEGCCSERCRVCNRICLHCCLLRLCQPHQTAQSANSCAQKTAVPKRELCPQLPQLMPITPEATQLTCLVQATNQTTHAAQSVRHSTSVSDSTQNCWTPLACRPVTCTFHPQSSMRTGRCKHMPTHAVTLQEPSMPGARCRCAFPTALTDQVNICLLQGRQLGRQNQRLGPQAETTTSTHQHDADVCCKAQCADLSVG